MSRSSEGDARPPLSSQPCTPTSKSDAAAKDATAKKHVYYFDLHAFASPLLDGAGTYTVTFRAEPGAFGDAPVAPLVLDGVARDQPTLPRILSLTTRWQSCVHPGGCVAHGRLKCRTLEGARAAFACVQ